MGVMSMEGGVGKLGLWVERMGNCGGLLDLGFVVLGSWFQGVVASGVGGLLVGGWNRNGGGGAGGLGWRDACFFAFCFLAFLGGLDVSGSCGAGGGAEK